MGKNKGILVVDVGTTKVCALIGEEREGELWITGKGLSRSRGLKKGAIVNIEEAATSIKEAVDQAVQQADCDIEEVYSSISGSHVNTVKGMGVVALRERQVTPIDVDKVLEAARAVEIPEDREILHEVPQEFVIDNQRGILQPIGMAGVRMEAYVQLITVHRSSLQNLLKCFELIGLEVDNVFFQGLASAEAVLTEEEKDLGVLLIDFGGGTTDGVIYWEGVLRDVFSIPVGGEHLTQDLAVGLRTSKGIADKLKIEKGVCLRDLAEEEDSFEVPGIGNRPPRMVNQKIIAEILEPRVKELLEIIELKIEELNLRPKITAGVVFTGGSSLIPGLTLLADQILDMPTRIGYPPEFPGLAGEVNLPQYATAVGMLMEVFKGREMQPREKKRSFWEKIKKLFK